MTKYIDFKLLKQQLTFDAIFARYGIKPIADGEDHCKIRCPFHDDHKPSCGVHTGRKIWQCFACGQSGNALEFIARIENLDPSTKDGIRDAALIAAEMIGVKSHERPKASGENSKAKARDIESATDTEPTAPAVEHESEDDRDNSALTFELKLDAKHAFLRKRGYKAETYERFGIGYAKRGMMKGRVCFPLREPDGKLVGYVGRWAIGELPEDTPRYLLPTGLNKSRILWNWHRVSALSPDHVVIVEGFWSVLRLEEAGIPAVALMGHKLFDRQIEMLTNAGVTHVTLILDGDDAGRAAAEKASATLANHLYVRSILLPNGIKPDTMDAQFLEEIALPA